MKKLIFFIFCLLGLTPVMLAQQQGVIRTPERPEKHSEGVPGVTINVLEYPNTIVSEKGGKFSFYIKGKRQGESFTVTRVQKKGYSLIDKQMNGRRFAYSSSVPIEIVMVLNKQLENDKKRIEDKAYTKAKNIFEQKLAALESQLKLKAISEQEYRAKYEELSNNYSNYVALIDEMAERYAMTDYKGLNEISRLTLECIENADLERADSLINSKGDFDKREQELSDKRALKEKSDQLSHQLEKDIDIEFKDLMQDYSNKFYIHASAYHNDSAAHYLERMVRLDSNDVDIVFYTASFIDKYLANYPKALKYYLMALDKFKAKGEEISPEAGIISQKIGLLYDNYDQPDTAMAWHHKALDILTKTVEPESPSISMAHTLIGRAYLNKGEYENALTYTQKGLKMREQAAVKDTTDLAQSYNNLGHIYDCIQKYDSALIYHLKALDLREQAFGEDNSHTAVSHVNLGSLYYDGLKDREKALEHFNKAYPVFMKQYGIAHPHTQTVLYYLGNILFDNGNYEKALEYYLMALEGAEAYFGKKHSTTLESQNKVAATYIKLGDSQQAKRYYQNTLDVIGQEYGAQSISMATAYTLTGIYLKELNAYELAMPYFLEAQKIFDSLETENEHKAVAYSQPGHIYYEQGNYDKALELYVKALDIEKRVFGENHPYVARCLQYIGNVYKKTGKKDLAIQNYQLALNIYENVPDKENHLDKIEAITQDIKELQDSTKAN